jgi:hypothetical protein
MPKIVYKGKEVEKTEEELVDLAQKGLLLEEKSREFNERERSQKEEAEGYNELREWVRANPEAGQVMNDFISHVEEKGSIPKVDFESAEDSLSPRDRESENRIAALEAELADRRAAEAQDRMARQIVEIVSDRPVLAEASKESYERFGRDMVLEELTRRISSDPKADVMTLADTLATELAERRKQPAPKVVKETNEEKSPERFETESPAAAGGGEPAPEIAEEQYSYQDMKSGRLSQAVAKFLEAE